MAKVSKAKGKHQTPVKDTPIPNQAPATPATRSPWNMPVGWALALGLAALGVLLLLLRWRLIDIPLERDESSYAYLGKQILQGKLPYRDAYEMKPPLLLYSYALLVSLFGATLKGLHWAALALTFWNSAWVMAIGSRFLGLFYGFIAAIAYVLLTANPFASAIFLESELVVMGFVLPGIYSLLRWEQKAGPDKAPGHANAWLFAGSFLLVCGTLVKQSGIYFLGFPVLLLLVTFLQEKDRHFRQLLFQSLWVAAGMAIPVAGCLLLMAALGVWDDFWFWNVRYVQVYASGLDTSLRGLAFSMGFGALVKHNELYWMLGAVGLLSLLAPVVRSGYRILLAGFFVLSLITVTPGWRFYGHYWLQFLPALALVIGAAFYTLEKGAAKLLPRLNLRLFLAILAGMLLSFPIVRQSHRLFSTNLGQQIQAIFPGNPYDEDQVLAGLIAKRMAPEDQIAVLGSEPQYYLYLDRNAPSRHFYTAFLMRPIPESNAWQQEALDSLIQKKPRFVVFNFIPFSWMPKPNSNLNYYNASYKFTRANYRPIAWAEFNKNAKTNYILEAEKALNHTPASENYITVYERSDARSEIPADTQE